MTLAGIRAAIERTSLSAIVGALHEAGQPELARQVLELARAAAVVGLETPIGLDSSTRTSKPADASTGQQGARAALDAAAAEQVQAGAAKRRTRKGRAA